MDFFMGHSFNAFKRFAQIFLWFRALCELSDVILCCTSTELCPPPYPFPLLLLLWTRVLNWNNRVPAKSQPVNITAACWTLSISPSSSLFLSEPSPLPPPRLSQWVSEEKAEEKKNNGNQSVFFFCFFCKSGLNKCYFSVGSKRTTAAGKGHFQLSLLLLTCFPGKLEVVLNDWSLNKMTDFISRNRLSVFEGENVGSIVFALTLTGPVFTRM